MPDLGPGTLLLAPSRIEMTAVLNRLGHPTRHLRGEFKYCNRRTLYAVTGVGQSRAADTLRRICRQTRIDRVILCGLAGGLDPACAVGTVIEPRWVIDESQQRIALHDDNQPFDSAASLLTLDRLVHKVAAKQQLFRHFAVPAIDMESFAVAQVAEQCNVKLKIVRAISDPADMAMPPQAARWLDAAGNTKIGTVMCDLLLQPWRIGAVMHLGRCAKLAMQQVATRVEALLAPVE